MVTDEQLAESAQGGSTAAFGELVERYQGRLLRFLLARCRSRADAEDVLQDSFMNAYRYLHSFDTDRRFSTWLYRIAIRNAARLVPVLGGEPAEPVDYADPLAECIVQSERENLWIVAKSALSPDACSAMWLHYVEDLPLGDVARALNRSLAWTKVSLMRSRRRLQVEMGRQTTANERSKVYGQA